MIYLFNFPNSFLWYLVIDCPPLDPTSMSPSLTWTCSKKNHWASVCTFKCENGREISGDKIVICHDDDKDLVGEWAELPYCIGLCIEFPNYWH